MCGPGTKRPTDWYWSTARGLEAAAVHGAIVRLFAMFCNVVGDWKDKENDVYTLLLLNCFARGSLPGPCLKMDLLNWMLAKSCQRGHLDVVRLLVHSYHANVRDFAIHCDDFAVINGLPLYAAAQAGN